MKTRNAKLEICHPEWIVFIGLWLITSGMPALAKSHSEILLSEALSREELAFNEWAESSSPHEKKSLANPQKKAPFLVKTEKILQEKSVADLTQSDAELTLAPSDTELKKSGTTLARELPKYPKWQLNSGTSQAVQVIIPNGSIEEEGIEAGLVDQEAVTANSVVRKALQEPQNREEIISITEQSEKNLEVSPASIHFKKLGQKVTIDLKIHSPKDLQLFVRHSDLLHWDNQKLELLALKQGQTEVYMIHAGRMYILPVSIQEPSQSPQLEVPQALVSLNSLPLNPESLHASYQSSSGSENERSALTNTPPPDLAIETLAATPLSAAEQAPLSLQASRAETALSLASEHRKMQHFQADAEPLSYGEVTVQIIDERSQPDKGKIFPVSGAHVHIIGTEFIAPTDETGHLTIKDIPMRSRFWVAISDPAGKIVATTAELHLTEKTKGVIRIRTVRTWILDSLTQILGVTQDTTTATLCGILRDKPEGQGQEGLTVTLDTEASRPIYFNSLGLPDPLLKKTGPDGRFCFFHVSAGPLSLGIFEDQVSLAATSTAVLAGMHRELEIPLSQEKILKTRLVMMPSAHTQLSSDPVEANAFKPIDMIDLIPLGDDTPMMQLEAGLVATADPILAFGNRFWAFAQASEFEPMIYPYDIQDESTTITPLFLRGFIEDMAVFAQIPWQADLGSVIAEYGGTTASNSVAGISFKLVDGQGQTLAEPWYYADKPSSKAIYFNVPPGAYTLLVETAEGHWLAAETIIVFAETTSYLRLGGKIKLRS